VISLIVSSLVTTCPIILSARPSGFIGFFGVPQARFPTELQAPNRRELFLGRRLERVHCARFPRIQIGVRLKQQRQEFRAGSSRLPRTNRSIMPGVRGWLALNCS
jgi:hypothetical protein